MAMKAKDLVGRLVSVKEKNQLNNWLAFRVTCGIDGHGDGYVAPRHRLVPGERLLIIKVTKVYAGHDLAFIDASGQCCWVFVPSTRKVGTLFASLSCRGKQVAT